ncbi:hypothetical protein RU639_005096 [Aspergillus parasiticus]
MTFQQQLRDFYVGKDVLLSGRMSSPIRPPKSRKCKSTIRVSKGIFIASIILEIETLVPLLKKLKEEGRDANVLYGSRWYPRR